MNNLFIRSFPSAWIQDPEQSLGLAKLILNGSPLYREVVNQLYSFSLDRNIRQNRGQWQDWIDDTFKLMLKRCNDESFVNALTDFQNHHFQWNNMRYLPDAGFVNLQKQVTPLKTFISEKPTIIYSSNEWSVGRYEMDDFAKENPEINFVLINGGSNFGLWKDWNDRAEPVAHQLFLICDTVRLQDIFLDKLNKYIIYNRSGERIGVGEDLKKAVSIARESLNPKKKELNKSTLQGIILFLSGSMLLFLILFLAYKYRMKQRLKKQTQENRLRWNNT